jgi:Fur family transcriptional regulator, peroxide stress response regulator
MDQDKLRDKLSSKGLKVTPQRIAVLEAVTELKDHPATDRIISYVKRNYPFISSGTVYKTLEIFTEKSIVNRVKTGRDILRYDPIMEKHHHLYCARSEKIEDYFDEELNEMLEDYFGKKGIPGFSIEDIKLQIIGKFE